jgi:hypothetical protein
VLVGLSAYYWVPGYPRDAKARLYALRLNTLLTSMIFQFLTDLDREILIARLSSDSDSGDHEPFTWHGVGAWSHPLSVGLTC